MTTDSAALLWHVCDVAGSCTPARRVGQRQVLVGAARSKARALIMQRESRAGATQGLDRLIAETERNKVTSNKCKFIVR
jgi:hypothetical protein